MCNFYKKLKKIFLYNFQKYMNRVMVFQIAVRGGRIANFMGVANFFTGWREPEEEWFWRFEPFSKLETAFSEYWASIKIKINMTCVSKEYEIIKKWNRSNDYS